MPPHPARGENAGRLAQWTMRGEGILSSFSSVQTVIATMEKIAYRVRTRQSIEGRMALGLLREAQAGGRALTTRTLHKTGRLDALNLYPCCSPRSLLISNGYWNDRTQTSSSPVWWATARRTPGRSPIHSGDAKTRDRRAQVEPDGDLHYARRKNGRGPQKDDAQVPDGILILSVSYLSRKAGLSEGYGPCTTTPTPTCGRQLLVRSSSPGQPCTGN
jgi:hypothetical protein